MTLNYHVAKDLTLNFHHMSIFITWIFVYPFCYSFKEIQREYILLEDFEIIKDICFIIFNFVVCFTHYLSSL